jgi:hypothetical protein
MVNDVLALYHRKERCMPKLHLAAPQVTGPPALRPQRRRRTATLIRVAVGCAGLLLASTALAPVAHAVTCTPDDNGGIVCTGGGGGGGPPQPFPPPPPGSPPAGPAGPDSGHVLAYQRSPAGSWQETDLTASIGAPTASEFLPSGFTAQYDSITGRVEAYVNANGNLMQFAQTPGSSSWVSTDLTTEKGGASIDGPESAIVTSTGVDVFALSESAQELLDFAWTAATGWQVSVVGTTSLNTALGTSGFVSGPRALWDGHNVHVYISEITGTETIPQITEFFSAAGGPWQRFTLTHAMDNPTPMLVGGTVNVVGRQDVATNGNPSCCTYGTTGHVLDLTEPADSPGTGVTVTDVTAAAGVTPLPGSLFPYPATAQPGGVPEVFAAVSTARNSAGGDIPLLQEYAATSAGSWQAQTLNGAAGATPFGEDGIGDPTATVDTAGGVNILIDNASAPANGYDSTGTGRLQDYRWTSAGGWQVTDITTATSSPLITYYPAAAATPQGYLYAFAAES